MSLDRLVGEKIKSIMKEKKIEMPQMSILTGIKYKTLWSYVNGTRGVDFQTLSDICKVLDIKASDFMKDIEDDR